MLFGLSPRSCAESVSAPVSVPKDSALNDGRFCCSDWMRSGWPTRFSASAPSTSTGAGLSAAFSPLTRVPVTMTSATDEVSAAAPAALAPPPATRTASKLTPP